MVFIWANEPNKLLVIKRSYANYCMYWYIHKAPKRLRLSGLQTNDCNAVRDGCEAPVTVRVCFAQTLTTRQTAPGHAPAWSNSYLQFTAGLELGGSGVKT